MDKDTVTAVNALLAIAQRYEPVQAAALAALLRRVQADAPTSRAPSVEHG